MGLQIDDRPWVTVMVPVDYYDWMMAQMRRAHLHAQITGDYAEETRAKWFVNLAKATTVGTDYRRLPITSGPSPRHRVDSHQ